MCATKRLHTCVARLVQLRHPVLRCLPLQVTTQLLQHRLHFREITTALPKMASKDSDETYSAFLNKYSSAPTASSTNLVEEEDQSKFFSAIPTKLLKTPSKSDTLHTLTTEKNKSYYSSETDLPFLPVFIEYAGKELPSAEAFADAVSVDGELVERMDVKDWDPKGQYKGVVELVQKGTKGDAVVYKVLGEGSRVGYFVLGLVEMGLEGVRVGAVES